MQRRARCCTGFSSVQTAMCFPVSKQPLHFPRRLVTAKRLPPVLHVGIRQRRHVTQALFQEYPRFLHLFGVGLR